MWKRSRRQRGYSLTEMLVVVALIGMFSLVSVPQFMTYYRQSKVRASVRQFAGHLRQARAIAISKNVQMAVSFAPGTTPDEGVAGQYGLFQRVVDTSTDPDTISWNQVGGWYRLEQPVYFLESEFAVDSAGDDTLHDVIFLPTGSLGAIPTPALVELKSDDKVPNNHCTFTLSAAGSFTSAMTTD